MKIAWFTPFAKESAIGYYSKLATEAIHNSYEVDIWVSNRDGNNLHPSELNVVRYTPDDNLEKLLDYDFLIYNMGNCYEYHIDIYKVLQRYKGILILHDVVMHNFFMGVWLLDENNQNGYIEYLGKRYGNEVQKLAKSSFRGEIVPPFWETDKCAEYPFIEKTIENATGIIVHSQYHYRIIESCFDGVLAEIQFPFMHKENMQRKTPKEKHNKVRLLTYGQVNRNKCVDKVIKAIGENEFLRGEIEYNIIGSLGNVNYVNELKELIKKYHLDDNVKLLGYRNDEELEQYINNTDIMMNLRFPAFEGASWSLLEQMSKGKFIIATETGCYSEISDECLVKIKPGNEEEEIEEILLHFCKNRSEIDIIGENAKRLAVSKYNAENYNFRFSKFIQSMEVKAPVEKLLDKIITELCNLGICSDMPIVTELVNKVEGFLGGEEKGVFK